MKSDRDKAAKQIDRSIRMFCDGVAKMVEDGEQHKKVGPADWVQMYSVFTQAVGQLIDFWQGIVVESVGARTETFEITPPLGKGTVNVAKILKSHEVQLV